MIRSRVRRALPATTVYTSLLLMLDCYINTRKNDFHFHKINKLPMINAEEKQPLILTILRPGKGKSVRWSSCDS